MDANNSTSMKENYLRRDYIPQLRSLDPAAAARWGKMNVHQMIEHMIDAFHNANGKMVFSGILSPDERIEKMQAFLLSDKPFKENTKNVLMPEDPLPVRYSSVAEAIDVLEREIYDFFSYWEINKNTSLRNPFFGDLDYEHWIGLLHKHAVHHLEQFTREPRAMEEPANQMNKKQSE